MNCPGCQIEYNSLHWGECPHCGKRREGREANADVDGVIKTSTILISSDEGGVFRSLEEVPERLRETLVSCTAGSNSATIVIADQGGRERIAAALRQVPPVRGSRSDHISAAVQGPPVPPRWHVPFFWWAGFLAAGFAGSVAWLVISHLP